VKKVREALLTYVAFAKLRDDFEPGPGQNHFSLVKALVTDTRLRGAGYIERDDQTFELTEESADRIDHLCQFEHRDSMAASDNKILREPKSVSRFSRIVQDANSAPQQATRRFAQMLKVEVEEGERTLDDAVDNLKTFKRNQAWAESLNKLMDNQEENLDAAEYTGDGNELMNRERVEGKLVMLERQFGLPGGDGR